MTSLQISYRDAVISDLDFIVSVYNSTIPARASTADLIPVSVESKIPWFESHNAHYPLWIAVQDTMPVGWISFSPWKSRDAYYHTAEVSIYIKEDFRGKGLGKTILDDCLNKASDLDLQNLMGVIFAHNKASVSLFEKAGFQHWGLLPDVCLIDQIPRSVVIMGKRL